MPNLILAFAAGFLIAWGIGCWLREKESRCWKDEVSAWKDLSNEWKDRCDEWVELTGAAEKEAERWREAFREAYEIKQGCGITTNDTKGK